MTTRLERRSLLLASIALAAGGPAGATTATGHRRIEGRWLYRSFVNLPDETEDFGRLRLASGLMELVLYSETGFIGVMTTPTYRLNLSGTLEDERFAMRATQASENTAGWHYEYVGWIAPRWPAAVDQVPTLVGTMLRAADHPGRSGGISRGGATYSFIAVQQS